MTYYPKSQIKTDLYTKGDQLRVKSTGENYIGFYWQTSRNEYFSGRTPYSGASVELQKIPVVQTPKISTLTYSVGNDAYNKQKGVNIENKLLLPFYQKPSPTQEDYDLGSLIRYFCKRNNENLYVETTKNIYNRIKGKDKGYAFYLYVPFSLVWQLTGNRRTVFQTNEQIVSTTEFQQNITGLKDYLNFIYIEFYK